MNALLSLNQTAVSCLSAGIVPNLILGSVCPSTASELETLCSRVLSPVLMVAALGPDSESENLLSSDRA